MADEEVAADSEKTKIKYSWNVKKFVERTPCARNSLLYGIVGGLLVGTGYFFKSMHVLKSCRYAVGSFAAITFGSWEVCRYVIHKEKEAIKETVDMLNKSRSQSDENE